MQTSDYDFYAERFATNAQTDIDAGKLVKVLLAGLRDGIAITGISASSRGVYFTLPDGTNVVVRPDAFVGYSSGTP